MQAYSPLVQGRLDEPVLVRLAKQVRAVQHSDWRVISSCTDAPHTHTVVQ